MALQTLGRQASSARAAGEPVGHGWGTHGAMTGGFGSSSRGAHFVCCELQPRLSCGPGRCTLDDSDLLDVVVLRSSGEVPA